MASLIGDPGYIVKYAVIVHCLRIDDDNYCLFFFQFLVLNCLRIYTLKTPVFMVSFQGVFLAFNKLFSKTVVSIRDTVVCDYFS